jgi:hypothetical protein
LAFLTRISPDLADLFQRWDTLPDAVRAGIEAMVRAAKNGDDTHSRLSHD